MNLPSGGAGGIGITFSPGAFNTTFEHTNLRVNLGENEEHESRNQVVTLRTTDGEGHETASVTVPLLPGGDEWHNVSAELFDMFGLVVVDDGYTFTSTAETPRTLRGRFRVRGGVFPEQEQLSVPLGSHSATAILESMTGARLIAPGYLEWNGVVGSGSTLTPCSASLRNVCCQQSRGVSAVINNGTTLSYAVSLGGTVTYDYRGLIPDTRPECQLPSTSQLYVVSHRLGS